MAQGFIKRGGGGGGTGNVSGPASSTMGALALWDDLTGTLLADGPVPGNSVTRDVGLTAADVAPGDILSAYGPPAVLSVALLPYARQTGQGSYDLNYAYGLNYINGSMKLEQLYSLSTAQAKFPKVFAWFTSPGFGEDDAWVMDLTHIVACWWEALLQGNGSGTLGTSRIGSNNEILVPRGNYLVNYQLVYDSGSYIGRGTEGAYDGADNTDLWFDRAGWKGDPLEDRAILMPSTYLDDTAFGYTQGTYIHGFRLMGGMNWSGYDPADGTDIGLMIWDMGECSRVGTIYAEGFHGLGVKIARGTPVTIDVLSVFENGLAGVGCYGNDLSTITIGTLSGDDNPALIRVREGYGRPAGGTINVGGLIKSESGKRIPNRGQIILDAADSGDTDGAYLRFTAATVWAAVDFAEVDALFVIRGFTGDNARICVNSFSGYNAATLVQDVTNGIRFPHPGSFDCFGFVWNATNGGTVWSPPPDNITYTDSPCAVTERLGFRPGGAGPPFDYTLGTPAYDYTQGSPSPPASDRSECYAGAVSGVTGDGYYSVGDTGQMYGLSTDQYGQPMAPVTPAYSQVGGTGTMTVNPTTGALTATATGPVLLRYFDTDDFADFWVEVI